MTRIAEGMNSQNPIDLLFGGMGKLGPGGDRYTDHVLGLVPRRNFDVVVDAGCGTGRQTFVLAKQLGALVHAVDSYEPFLTELDRRAMQAGLSDRIKTHHMDMKEIPAVWPKIDLLWSEGAAYNIGFANALSLWAKAVASGGFAVVSELSWLGEKVPDAVREFFKIGYPDMKHQHENVAVLEAAGYKVLDTYILPKDAWVDGYYDILEPRAKSLLGHSDSSVRAFAEETIKEIEIFARSEESYGYVFYVLQRG